MYRVAVEELAGRAHEASDQVHHQAGHDQADVGHDRLDDAHDEPHGVGQVVGQDRGLHVEDGDEEEQERCSAEDQGDRQGVADAGLLGRGVTRGVAAGVERECGDQRERDQGEDDGGLEEAADHFTRDGVEFRVDEERRCLDHGNGLSV